MRPELLTPHGRTELGHAGTSRRSLIAAMLIGALMPASLWLVAHPTVTVAVAGFLVGAAVVRAHLVGRVVGRLGRRRRRETARTATPCPSPRTRT